MTWEPYVWLIIFTDRSHDWTPFSYRKLFADCDNYKTHLSSGFTCPLDTSIDSNWSLEQSGLQESS